MQIPVFDLSTPPGRTDYRARVERLRQTGATGGEYGRIAAGIIDSVRERGDDAVVEQMRKWTDPDFTADRIRVTEDELLGAEESLDPDLRATILRAVDHVRRYQQHIMPAPPEPIEIDGAELGLRFTPVGSAGLTVPGGSAVLFSSLIMLAVPAQVAGVPANRISVVNPPPYRKANEASRDISPIVLGTCRLLGIERVYRIGGPAAVAALAWGTDTIDPVEMVVGPGHPVVAAAQTQLRGVIGTGDFYGASEIVTVADDSANPAFVAADLLAQAEHDPGKCFLVAWQQPAIDAILEQMRRQLPQRRRRDAILAALKNESAIVKVTDRAQAVAVADELAAEHVNLAVADPDAMLGELRHAGEVFLGDRTPVAAGDYWAGPSHTLPTDATARFASGVSVYTFLKRTGTVCYRGGLPADAVDAIARMAEAEGLDGHAHSVRVRAPERA